MDKPLLNSIKFWFYHSCLRVLTFYSNQNYKFMNKKEKSPILIKGTESKITEMTFKLEYGKLKLEVKNYPAWFLFSFLIVSNLGLLGLVILQ